MKPDLAKLLEYWQSLLRLRDWRLDVSYVPNLAAPDGTPCYGLCSPFVDAKEARINIRDPQSTDGVPAFDVEETLVHELLHLHFAPLAENTASGVAAEEQAVWAITEAISKVKDSGARARLAGAVARVANKARRVPRTKERKRKMDPVVLAALKAALTAEDPVAAIEALLAQLEGETQAPDADSTPATDADGNPLEQRAASAEGETNEEPKAARVQPRTGAARAAAAPARTVQMPASQLVTRKEFDGFRIERMLDARPDLTPAQRSFAMGLTYEAAQRFAKVTPPPETGASADAARTAPVPSGFGLPARAQLANKPAVGARGNAKPTTEDAILEDIDRRMGVPRAETPALQRDARGRLQISLIRPMPSLGSAKGDS